jgi:hypothetical protein
VVFVSGYLLPEDGALVFAWSFLSFGIVLGVAGLDGDTCMFFRENARVFICGFYGAVEVQEVWQRF